MAIEKYGQSMQAITIDKDRKIFIERDSGKQFRPLGFNYDHDEQFRLIEDYWLTEWDKVLHDLDRMLQLGANTIRLHLQTVKFLPQPDQPNYRQLDQLGKIIETAAAMGLYLNITGLGAYHREDQPDWYTFQREQARWQTQQKFWREVAKVTNGHNNVFCLNIMNEPVIAGGHRLPGEWLANSFVDGKHYTQFVVLKGRSRDRAALARKWLGLMCEAIREHDSEHLLTLGLMDWCLDRPGEMSSGFVPQQIVDLLDFLCIHVYPVNGKPEHFVETVRAFKQGKPVVIEEFSHLECELEDMPAFLQLVRDDIEGLITFYTDDIEPAETYAQREHNRGIGEIIDFFYRHGRFLFEK